VGWPFFFILVLPGLLVGSLTEKWVCTEVGRPITKFRKGLALKLEKAEK
jgi:hypothetical protein